jgi:hypothetical protein
MRIVRVDSENGQFIVVVYTLSTSLYRLKPSPSDQLEVESAKPVYLLKRI